MKFYHIMYCKEVLGFA